MEWKDLSQTWHFVEKWARDKPDHEAIVYDDRRITWAEFRDEMNLVATAYLDSGVEKGDRVALIAMACPEFLTSYMAAGKVGAVWLGISPKFSLDEMRFIIQDSKPTVLISLRRYLDTDLAENLKALSAEFGFLKKILVIGEPVEGCESFQAFLQEDRVHLDRALELRAKGISETDAALLMYTSGSTGKPKGVVHTHRSIIENIKVEVKHFCLEGDLRMLCHFPINHVAADVEVCVAAIMVGGTMVLMDRFDPEGSLDVIQREKITALGQIPAMFLLQFRASNFAPEKFATVRQFLWAGSAAPSLMVKVLNGIVQATGGTLITGYGSTEVCGFVTYTEPGDGPEVLLRTAGKIAEPFELKIVGPDRKELGNGAVGEIAVRGPFLMKGYFNRPDATDRVLDEEGWYYTSDLARRDEKGYIHIAGRSTEMFKSGGENVYPREVEDAIETHPAVLFASVISVPHEIFQEVGWAYVMPNPGQKVSEEELHDVCRERLANFKVPKRFFVRPMLPLLPNGKVDKVALRKEAEETLRMHD
jgi:acyl-CoA synthetase (AMP-forming)/AMP-acid ligase II